ncbi:ShlB/FhaC/HecB family hemolysin secretion/activation protein [Eleftheria terrae]|uniref:ShlB/FhaC/HecB family hemolysin secretion/activation protein n=1 Tax=Eleftheria terrae TaxID=1597781 RepID=UPI00263A740E|nr:ShlB/FhaC/HecB family hemolysin secretion/activation protein [Eleftheria terrae]WKB56081.1 ShlB/FhaC/HecB family hemolysin secretion/activation protein [Eleftheria terrae]
MSAASSSWAQTSTLEPGAREQQLREERERELRRQQETRPDVRLPRPATVEPDWTQPETPCFRIERVRLVGQSADRFGFALASVIGGADRAVGRCLGARGIAAVMAQVQNAIVERGFVTTRVLAAPQDLKSAELVLTVVPGRVRQVRFDAEAGGRATAWNAVPVSRGDVLNLRDIEQALENFKRVPTAEADIEIQPSTAADAGPGDSDLVIRWRQALPLRLALSVDDGGSRATGPYQGGVTLSYDHWWTLNDLFYLSLNHDLGGGETGERGTRGYTAHYSLPFGYWLLGATLSENHYRQAVAGPYETYLYSGQSRNAELQLSHVVYRDAVRKTTAALRGWLRASRNHIDDTEVENQRRRTAGWEVAASHREFIGTATLDARLAYRRGTGAFGAMAAPEQSFGEGSARMKIMSAELGLSGGAKVTTPWGPQQLRYSSSWRAQWNRTPLVPQDRFSIGGRYTVRGFDGETVLSADRGWLLRNEIGLALGSSGQEAYLGLDHGEVSGPSAAWLVGRRLTGAVLGLRGGWRGFSYDAFAGTPVARPAGFQAAHTVTGFSLNWSL